MPEENVPVIEVIVTSNGANEIQISKEGIWEASYTDTWTKSLTLESPTASDDVSLFFTEYAITITKVAAVLIGSSSPSLSWTLKYDSDRNGAGTEILTGGFTTTSTTTGDIVTSLTNFVVPKDNYIWLETSGVSGTVSSININLLYTIT